MEDSISLTELDFMIRAIRKDAQDERVFFAALQGVDLNGGNDSIEEKRREIERRAAEKLHGYQEVERQELAEFGFSFVSE